MARKKYEGYYNYAGEASNEPEIGDYINIGIVEPIDNIDFNTINIPDGKPVFFTGQASSINQTNDNIAVEKANYSTARPPTSTSNIVSFNLTFDLSDIDLNNNIIIDSDASENTGFFANSVTNIQISNIRRDGNNGTFQNPPPYLEANLLVEESDNGSIVYTLVDDQRSPLGISKANGSIISVNDSNNQNVEIQLFELNSLNSIDIFNGKINSDSAINSLDYIIEENLFSNFGFKTLGTEQDDTLIGGGADDTLIGLAGDDTLYGQAGDDYIIGDEGNDRLHGGSGNDRLYGEADNDRLYGNDGNDLVDGGSGNDHIVGQAGDDTLYGQAGDDALYGYTGNDILVGGDGDDYIVGDEGDDRLLGESGNDILVGKAGNDTLIGGTGSDIFRLSHDLEIDTIEDFNRAEGDKIQVIGSQNDYTLSFGNVSGNAAAGTIIEYQGNQIAIVADTVTVDLNTDFVFL